MRGGASASARCPIPGHGAGRQSIGANSRGLTSGAGMALAANRGIRGIGEADSDLRAVGHVAGETIAILGVRSERRVLSEPGHVSPAHVAAVAKSEPELVRRKPMGNSGRRTGIRPERTIQGKASGLRGGAQGFFPGYCEIGSLHSENPGLHCDGTFGAGPSSSFGDRAEPALFFRFSFRYNPTHSRNQRRHQHRHRTYSQSARYRIRGGAPSHGNRKLPIRSTRTAHFL
ncbi:MAG: hypothetical protein KatS3mg081_1567 [Gemmatimonadales bacterium]|nr:MAG: hypothetical protein KatS3mg081_1567 [Gemmatimonadales bacterium]